MSNELLRAAVRPLPPGVAWRLGGALALCTLTSACAGHAAGSTSLGRTGCDRHSCRAKSGVHARARAGGQRAGAVAPSTLAVAPSLVVTHIDNVGEQEATAAAALCRSRARPAPAELGLEIAALGEPGTQPLRQMQLAVALMHTNQPVERACAGPAANGWRPTTRPMPHPAAGPFDRATAHGAASWRKPWIASRSNSTKPSNT